MVVGEAASVEAMEKAVLMAGNVQCVAGVSADPMQATPQTGKVEYYVIQKGDMLSAIAKKFLGNASTYPKIFEANREMIFVWYRLSHKLYFFNGIWYHQR